MKIAVLISGKGSNLKALLEKDQGRNITFVLANKPAPGLQYARMWNIPYAINVKENDMLQTLKDNSIDMIFLAGFMHILSPNFIAHFTNKIINIHPSLLPKYKGLHTHKRVLENKESVHGCTCHIVTSDLDNGPILAQVQIPIYPNDTAIDLEKRVLDQEHRIYPIILEKIINGELTSLINNPILT